MKSNSVNIKNISCSKCRIDASFHLSEGISVRRIIDGCPYKSIFMSEVTSEIFYGNRARRVYVSDAEHGIPFLSSSEILLSDFDNVKYASRRYTSHLEQLKLEKDWILISRSGTIGNCAYTNGDFSRCLSSEHVIRVVPNGQVKSGMLYAYLSSYFGYLLLTQGTFGAVIQHIEPDYVASIPVPCFPVGLQNDVDSLIKSSSSLREEATLYRKRAISIIEKFLNSIPNPHTSKISNFQICTSHHRIDSQYQMEVLIRRKDNVGLPYFKIGDKAKNIYVGNRGKRCYVNKGVPFLSSSEMMLFNPKRWCKQISVRTPSLHSLGVKEKDILISRSGTIGNCLFVSKGLKDVTISEHALRLRIDDSKVAPEYVYAFLCSWQGQRKLKNAAYGSVIITLGEGFVSEISVPIIPEKDYKEVVELIELYAHKNDEAAELESKAIKLVEEEIESWSK